MSKIVPFQYPLIVGAISANAEGVPLTLVRTATTTIPFNSKFVWLHTLNATISDTNTIIIPTVRTIIYDSINGPICNVPTLIQNMAGAIFETFSASPRSIRPFPLPEAYLFNAGAVLTATYTITMPPANGGAAPSFASVGLILCGYRFIIEGVN